MFTVCVCVCEFCPQYASTVSKSKSKLAWLDLSICKVAKTPNECFILAVAVATDGKEASDYVYLNLDFDSKSGALSSHAAVTAG